MQASGSLSRPDDRRLATDRFEEAEHRRDPARRDRLFHDPRRRGEKGADLGHLDHPLAVHRPERARGLPRVNPLVDALPRARKADREGRDRNPIARLEPHQAR